MKAYNLLMALCVVLAVLFAGCGNNAELPETTSAALSGGETVIQPSTTQPKETSPPIEQTEDLPEETEGSVDLIPAEPPVVLEFDSLDEFEQLITAAKGTEAEFLAVAENSVSGWDKKQDEMLYLYDKFSELSLPRFAAEKASVMYFPDTDTLDIMYKIDETCYRFLFSEADGDEKGPEGEPVATDVRFGPYTVDLVATEPGGDFDFRVGGGTVQDGIYFHAVIYGILPDDSTVEAVDMGSLAEMFSFEPIREKTVTDTHDPAPYISDNMEDFLQAWLDAQTGDAPAHELSALDDGSTGDRIKVPVLRMEGYEFWAVEATEYYCSYYYAPVGTTDKADVGHETSFEILMSKKVGFETTMKKEGLEPVDGLAYCSEDNLWYLDNDGKLITLYCPEGIVFENAEEVAEHLTFEIYTVSEGDQLMKVEDVSQ